MPNLPKQSGWGTRAFSDYGRRESVTAPGGLPFVAEGHRSRGVQNQKLEKELLEAVGYSAVGVVPVSQLSAACSHIRERFGLQWLCPTRAYITLGW